MSLASHTPTLDPEKSASTTESAFTADQKLVDEAPVFPDGGLQGWLAVAGA